MIIIINTKHEMTAVPSLTEAAMPMDLLFKKGQNMRFATK